MRLKNGLTAYSIFILLFTFGNAYSQQTTKPILRFGVVADCQYHSKANRGTRYYSKSNEKLQEAIATFNSENVDFNITLGDLIDADFENLSPIVNTLKTAKAKTYHTLGNHDYQIGDKDITELMKTIGMSKRYYDFAMKGYRFIILDGSDISLYADKNNHSKQLLAKQMYDSLKHAGNPAAQTWNGATGDQQVEWLEKTLAKAYKKGEKAILFCHFPLLPKNSATLWNSDRILEIIDKNRSVVAYMNGHEHAGGEAYHNDVMMYTFMGMVEKADNYYAIVELYPDSLQIKGYGKQPSLKYKFPIR